MKPLLHLGAALSALAVITSSSYGTVIITVGNNPQAGDENILLTNGDSGAQIFGTGNQSGFQVSFSSITDTLLADASGQATIGPTAPDTELNDITIAAPGRSFTSLIVNAFNGSGDVVFNIIANEPGLGEVLFSFTGFTSGNGQNFFTITTAGGETLSSVNIASADGFADLRQVRIGGLAAPGQVPDGGATLSLLSLGMGALAMARRRQ